MFIWIYKLGIGINCPSSFSRFDENGTVFGPYTMWFERKFLIFFWAVTSPKQSFGFKKI
jgi:hypothetical protein